MRTVAAAAAEMLSLFGIPAQLEGSLIRVNTGLVGVNEACSGVRSLQTSLMIGLLFGELKRFSTSRRFLLLSGVLGVALVANFSRAFFLVWVAAREGVPAVERWHDFAGYSIVAVVFGAALAFAALLGNTRDRQRNGEGREMSSVPSPNVDRTKLLSPNSGRSRPLSTSCFALCLAWIVFVEVGAETWYRMHEVHSEQRLRWTVRWPERAPGFRELHIDEQIKGALRFDEAREASWHADQTPVSAGAGPQTRGARKMQPVCFVFLFRWKPGATTILRARAHRPDICLPSSGWRQTNDCGVRSYSAADNISLPFRHFQFVRDLPGQPRLFADAFFCLTEDAVPPGGTINTTFDPASKRPANWVPADRVRVVRAGLRNPGQQVMQVTFISPSETSAEDAEAQFAALLSRVVVAEGEKGL